MAVNFYGNCTGSSASKYDIWIKATQNSQSIESNKSNITIKLYLKRNDGYAASAYNLNESDNSVKITVGGVVKVSKNITVDTRNGVTVTLASWTGDVTHGDDGSLDLKLGGQFTMSGTSLSGGSVSGTFPLTDIPRASSLTMNKTTLNPADSVTFTVSAASNAFTHKIVLTLGAESLSYSLSAGVLTKTITVPLNWAELVVSSKYQYISVYLYTYKSGNKIGAKTYKLKLTIPQTDDYLPGFSLIVTRVDKGVPSSLEEYVKNKSQVTLNVSGVSLKHGASVSSYTAKVGSTSKGSLPATFDLTESGNVTVSVTLKDSRGYSVKKTAVISVRDYEFPSVNITGFYRCDENGNSLIDGTSLYIDYNLIYSSVNSKNASSLTVKYRKTDSTLWSGEETVTGAGVVFKNALDYGSSYIIAFTVKDLITTEGLSVERSLSSSDIPFNIKKGGKGAAFGCYAERDNELTVNWDLNVLGSIYSEELSFNLNEAVAEKLVLASKYIPCLNICFFRFRVGATADLAAGNNYTLGYFNKSPVFFTPLSIYIGNDANSSLKCGIKAGDGAVVIRTSHAVAKGENIYIAGMFISDYINGN